MGGRIAAAAGTNRRRCLILPARLMDRLRSLSYRRCAGGDVTNASIRAGGTAICPPAVGRSAERVRRRRVVTLRSAGCDRTRGQLPCVGMSRSGADGSRRNAGVDRGEAGCRRVTRHANTHSWVTGSAPLTRDQPISGHLTTRITSPERTNA